MMRRVGTFLTYTLLFGLAIHLSACSSQSPFLMMQTPDVYASVGADPFATVKKETNDAAISLLYATDRAPANEDPRKYSKDRGHVLRVGLATIQVGLDDTSWDELRRVSLLKNRPSNFPLSVSEVDEFGRTASTMPTREAGSTGMFDTEQLHADFVDELNSRLSEKQVKDIYIYVHGVKADFESPLLVASEMWHYLGYEGVMIAYAWPSTDGDILAYEADLETATYSARHFRQLLQFLAAATDARQIHVLGYSAGTRVVTRALADLALIHCCNTVGPIREKTKIGQVILVGSDLDEDVFAGYLEDGLTEVSESTSVYFSSKDAALSLSSWLFRRQRLGNRLERQSMDPLLAEYLRSQDQFRLIDVTDVPNVGAKNGHDYFRNNPWVSSDVLLTIRYGLAPDRRRLVQTDDGIWVFPPDYLNLLEAVIRQVNPALFPNEDER